MQSQLLNVLQGMTNDYNTQVANQQRQALEQQKLAAAQANAERTYGLQQAANTRQQQAFDLKNDKFKAVQEASNVQRNTNNGFSDAHQKLFDDYANKQLATYETPAQKNFNYDEQMAALSKELAAAPADNNSPERKAINSKFDTLRSTYATLGNKTKEQARDNFYTDLGNKYATVMTNSGDSGVLANTMADNTYEQRVYQQLMDTNKFTPTEALKNAKTQASLYMGPKTDTSNVAALIKNDQFNTKQAMAALEKIRLCIFCRYWLTTS